MAGALAGVGRLHCTMPESTDVCLRVVFGGGGGGVLLGSGGGACWKTRTQGRGHVTHALGGGGADPGLAGLLHTPDGAAGATWHPRLTAFPKALQESAGPLRRERAAPHGQR